MPVIKPDVLKHFADLMEKQLDGSIPNVYAQKDRATAALILDLRERVAELEKAATFKALPTVMEVAEDAAEDERNRIADLIEISLAGDGTWGSLAESLASTIRASGLPTGSPAAQQSLNHSVREAIAEAVGEFHARAVADEREACAKIVEGFIEPGRRDHPEFVPVFEAIATAIRRPGISY